MRKFKWLGVLVLVATLACSLFGCATTKEPVSLSLSGQNTQFVLGEDFSAEGLQVVVTQSDDTTYIAEENSYTVDSSAYNKDAEGDYEIVVVLNGTEISASYTVTVEAERYALTGDGVTFTVNGTNVFSAKEGDTVVFSYEKLFGYDYTVSVKSDETDLQVTDNTFTMPSSAVVVQVTHTAKLYPVSAPASVAFMTGVENNQVTVESRVSFTVTVPDDEIVSSVTVNGVAIEATDGGYLFDASDYLSEDVIKIDIAVNTSDRTYPVIAPSTVTFSEGVENGVVVQESNITFTVQPEAGTHVTAVKVNGTSIEQNEGVYSFAAEDYITATDSVITITVESEAHKYTETVVDPTCAEGGYTEHTCGICGASYRDSETEARFLLADFTKWQSDAMMLTNVSGGVQATQNRADTWNYNKRYVVIDIDVDQYMLIDIDGLTANNFAIQFTGTDDSYKKVLTETGKYVFSLAELGITKSGEYELNIYLEGAQGTLVYIRDLAFLTSADEQIHHYGAGVTTAAYCHSAGKVQYTCENCGRTHTDSIEARFLFADLSKWESGVTLTYTDYTAEFTITTADGWSVASRNTTLKPGDYLQFGGTGKFKVELKAAGQEIGTVIIKEQEFTGNIVTVPVSSVVTEEGEYTLLVYVVGVENSTHTVTDCYVLASLEDDVHQYGEWTEDANGKARTCSVCGKVDRVDKIGVTFSVDGQTTIVKVYPGEYVSAPVTPEKIGYNFDGWYNGSDKFDFEHTAISEALTLTAQFSPRNDTAYKTEYYEQQEDGSYLLIETKDYVGTTDALAQADTNEYQPSNEYLSFDAAHENNLLEGAIKADGSLVLRVYYSAEKLAAYAMSVFRGADSVVVTFEEGTVENGELVMLELRTSDNEFARRLYTAANGVSATFDTSNIDLRAYFAVIATENGNSKVVSVQAAASVVASADTGAALAAGTVNVDGIDTYGPPAAKLTENGGVLANGATTIQIFYAGDYDYAVLELSGISYCGSGGADSAFVQNTSGTNLGQLSFSVNGTSMYGSVLSTNVTFTKEQYGSGLKVIIYKYCAGDWEECKAGHPQEWIRTGQITFFKAVSAESSTLYAVNGNHVKFVAPSGQPFYSVDRLLDGTVLATFDDNVANEEAMLAVLNNNGNIVATYYATVGENHQAEFTVEAYEGKVLLAAVTESGAYSQQISATGSETVASLGKALYDPSLTSVVTTFHCRGWRMTHTAEGVITTSTERLYRQNYWVSSSSSPLNGYDYSFVYNGDMSALTSITLEYSFNKVCNCGGGDWFWIVNDGKVVGNFSCQDQPIQLYKGTITIDGETLAQCTSNTFYIFYGMGCSSQNAEHVGETLTFGTLTFNTQDTLAKAPAMDASVQIDFKAQEDIS